MHFLLLDLLANVLSYFIFLSLLGITGSGEFSLDFESLEYRNHVFLTHFQSHTQYIYYVEYVIIKNNYNSFLLIA